MPLHETAHQTSDLLEGHAEAADAGWRRPLLLTGAVLVLLLAGTAAVTAAQDDEAPGVVDASGSMVVDYHSNERATRPGSVLEEAQNTRYSGSIEVELPDRKLTGTVRLNFSWAAQFEGDQALIFHNWGQVFATFDEANCEGVFAWSFYREPHVTGGSLNLRCDDGSLLAAAAGVERDEDTGDGYRMFISLEDGAYVAG
jgi:hypothetical protein